MFDRIMPRCSPAACWSFDSKRRLLTRDAVAACSTRHKRGMNGLICFGGSGCAEAYSGILACASGCGLLYRASGLSLERWQLSDSSPSSHPQAGSKGVAVRLLWVYMPLGTGLQRARLVHCSAPLGRYESCGHGIVHHLPFLKRFMSCSTLPLPPAFERRETTDTHALTEKTQPNAHPIRGKRTIWPAHAHCPLASHLDEALVPESGGQEALSWAGRARPGQLRYDKSKRRIQTGALARRLSGWLAGPSPWHRSTLLARRQWKLCRRCCAGLTCD
ncbi:hypothetical protein BD289DRAFT_117526 [Coniella lustricola]|uniref:Uncharacterized protein n=1 Tax=Coniella lustricola TaxID=2025994 RepID=A0A2T2ZWT8_9PEZI|nr:hypothetical protein BD289DRAFT_117526 [Coniella lustricola]